ncbi:mucin-5AC-like [Anabas testudineus]|uniref:mucin-5AC-like n=1 Tax=Anabas testudineus TaxID=64144 RepID=UPI000E463B2F|nr:mucin-5AC-like [Anabas testudineus]
MANETVQTSCIQENSEADECRENIAPEVTAGAGKQVQVGDVTGCFSAQTSGENKTLSDTCTFSTPAPTSSNGGVKAKSRLSGLQSALTPILKYLNIGNKCSSPEPVKHGNNLPCFPFNLNPANCQKSATGSSQHTNSRSHFVQSLGDKDASVCWLDDEYLPEITLLDVTCDSTMQLTRNDSALPDSAPGTPGTTRSLNGTFTTRQHLHSSSSTAQKLCHQKKIQALLQSDTSSPKGERETTDKAPSTSLNTTETLLVMNLNNTVVKPSGLGDVQNITSDRPCIQKPFGSTILEEAGANALFLKNKNGIITQRNSNESHQNNIGKSSPSRICNAFTITKGNHSGISSPDLSNYTETMAVIDPNVKIVDTPMRANAPLRWLDDRYFPEITLLDVTHDSEFSPGGEMSSMEVTQDVPPSDNLKNNTPSGEVIEEVITQPSRSDITQGDEFSSTFGSVNHTKSPFSEQSDKCAGENSMKVSLTQDISMSSVLENSRTSTEPSEQNIVKSQTSAEDTLGTHPANVTHDISSSSDMSSQCAASQLSTSDMQCSTSLTNVPSELHGEPVKTSNTVVIKNEELITSHDTEATSKMPQPSPETAGSANNTFTIVQSTNVSASTNTNTTTKIPNALNQTLDLSPSNGNSPKVDNDNKEEASLASKNTTEASLRMGQNCSVDKGNSPCHVQNTTFDHHSPQKSCESTTLQETGLQNNTFDSKPPSKQNGTITLSEVNSSDSHQNTLDKTSPSKVCNLTFSPKDRNSDVHHPEPSKPEETASTSKQNSTLTSSTISSSDSHQNTLDKTSPSKVCNLTFSPKDRNSDVHRPEPSKPEETASTSKQNSTLTSSKISSSDSHQNTLDEPSVSKVCNLTSSPKDSNSEVHHPEPSKPNEIITSTEPNVKMFNTPEVAIEAISVVAAASESGRHESKDQSQPSLPMIECLSDTLGHQSMDTGNGNAKAFNLDDTLDLRVDSLVTSTPMPNCKMFSLCSEREDCKTLGAQKKLYGDGAGKPVVQVPSDVPSNIVCDRKTFLTQPAAKSLLPPLKAACQLLKYKTASTLPGRFEPSTSGLPMTRQRTQAEALRNTAAPDPAQGTSGISSYNLRATTTGLKQPTSGLTKPHLTAIPSGIQRAAPGLRPPSTRSNTPASLSTDKLRGPTATNPVVNNSQAKRHPLTRGESLPTAKRKKMEAPLTSSATEAPASSCDAANRTKSQKHPVTSQRPLPAKSKKDGAAVPANTAETSAPCDAAIRARVLKQPATSHKAVLPKPPGHGCAKCIEFEEQLKMKSEEIKQLKEELLKYSKQEEEC